MNNNDLNIAALVESIVVSTVKALQTQNIITTKSDANIDPGISIKLNAASMQFMEIKKTTLKVKSFNSSFKHRIINGVKLLGPDKLVCNIGEDEARNLITSKTGKPNEQLHYHKTWSEMFNYFVSKNYTLVNPFLSIPKVKIQTGEIVIVSVNHFFKILEYIKANYEDKPAELYNDVILLLRSTALRPNELLSITKRNIAIDEMQSKASLQITNTKNYQSRIVPAVGEAYNIIKKYYHQTKTFDDYLFAGRTIRGIKNHLQVDTVSKVFKNACKELKLPSNYCLYSLRATCASELYTRGLPLQEISRLLGHKNPTITAQYYARFNNVNNDKLVAALKESEINKINNSFNELSRKVV